MLENSRDRDQTLQRGYRDKRSFVSYRGCEYLFGVDAARRRAEVYEHSGGKCQACGLNAEWDYAELDHIKGGYGPARCWCRSNLQILCRRCHVVKHGRFPKWKGVP